MSLTALIHAEGWKIVRRDSTDMIEAFGQLFPLCHPLSIRLKLFRDETNPELKYQHMYAAHQYMWPDTMDTWNAWTETRFRAHCEGYRYISNAGGAGIGKSYDAAKIAILFWVADPKNRAVLVASTTLESLNNRIWGYVTRLLFSLSVKIPFHYMRALPAKVLYNKNDTIHGMFALAAKRGAESDSISSLIGRHPNKGLLLMLDEATDLPLSILSAIPNLESSIETFQCQVIGNSLSKFDLHGSLSTPEGSWDSINPMRDSKWKTSQKNGICLYFNPFNSPAIYETDPVKKAKLSKFLITTEEIEAKKKVYGEDSDSFYRFVLGFWRTATSAETVIDPLFIKEFEVHRKAEWGGLYTLHKVAGLDPSFSTGGDGCILRIATIGTDVFGQVVLDFRGEDLLYRIPITAVGKVSPDIQVADAVNKILSDHGIPMNHLVIDATGHGRSLGEVMRLRSGTLLSPIKMYTIKTGIQTKESFDVVVKTSLELWLTFRNFIQNKQIRGMDQSTVDQLVTRRVIRDEKSGKQVLEAKSAYKARIRSSHPHLAHSPDEADAAALCLQSAIINFGFHPGQKREVSKDLGFAHEKFSVFNQLRVLEERKDTSKMKKQYSPVATFLGDIGDIGGCKLK